MTDTKLQRLNMVESQVRPSDVTDRRVLKAMLEVPREAFVPEARRAMAYMDEAVQVASPANGVAGRYLLPPRTFAKLVQLAEIEPHALVLDVGCATGYSTAILGRIARKVVALEADRQLAQFAARALQGFGIDNVKVIEGDLMIGAPVEGPFDAIILEGAVPEVPQSLLEQLKDGGRLVAVMASGPLGSAQVWRRSGKTFGARPAFDAGAEVLPGFAREPGFVF